jgi:hypothetical protein
MSNEMAMAIEDPLSTDAEPAPHPAAGHASPYAGGRRARAAARR